MIIYQPYTYLLGWTKVNLWYYGVRYSKTCNPNDIWNPYRTSSRYVKLTVELFGEPDIIQVRKTFTSVDKAREWEHKVLRRLKVTKEEKWLNKTDNISIDPTLSAYNKGKKYPLELRQKMSILQKEAGGYGPKKHSDETKNKMKERRKGKSPAKGCKWSEEQKKRHSEACKKRKNKSHFKKGYIFIKNDNEQKNIDPNELQYYLNLGWERGIIRDNSYLQKLNRDPEIIKKRTNSNKGKKRSLETRIKISESRRKNKI